MGDDYRELANHLFATATAMLEDVIEVAVAGQSWRLTPSQLADTAAGSSRPRAKSRSSPRPP